MAEAEPESVSPEGIRDGDPAVLAALCTERGPAVLAYASAVCPPEVALRAAAEAFARFRAALGVLGEIPGLDVDALLLGATRRATAELCPPVAAGVLARRRACADVPVLLAARLEGELGPAEEARLAEHLARDARCREIEQRFLAAEHAFAHPPAATPSPEAAAAIVGALAAAAPSAGAGAGAGGHGEPAAVTPAAPVPAAPVEAPDGPPGPDDATQAPPPPADPTHADLPPEAVPAAPEASTTAHDLPPAVPSAVAAAGPPPLPDDDGPSRPPAFARARRHRPVHEAHHGVVRTVVLPLAVVGAAAVAAMAIAGVFGEGEPLVPTAQPPITAPVETIPPRTPAPGTTPAPERIDEDAEPPPIARGNGEGEDVLGGLGVPAPGVAGAPAG